MPVRDSLPPDLDDRLASLGPALAEVSDDILFAYLFGSTSTAARTHRSDVDIAVHVREGTDLHRLRLAAMRAVTKHLRTDAVDLVVLNTAPLALAGRILRTRRVLLDREPWTRHLYESRIARLFQDFRIREERILAARGTMVDRALIRRRLVLLETYASQLAPYRSLTLEDYVADWKTQRVVERTLHLAIETCMDVADHIVADRRLRVPDTAAESFDILGEAGLLSSPLARRLGQMVGFRNILVHDYTRRDSAIVIRVLHEDVDDLVRFRDEIVSLT